MRLTVLQGSVLGHLSGPPLTWASRWLPPPLKPSLSNSNPNPGSIIPVYSVSAAPAVGAASQEDTSHLLLCVDRGDSETRLHQKRIEHCTTDRELFIFLRDQYCNYRQPKIWFSLRSVSLLSLSRVRLTEHKWPSSKLATVLAKSVFSSPLTSAPQPKFIATQESATPTASASLPR